MARLTIQHGKDAGRYFTLADGITIVGREKGVTLQLMDEIISRKHCLLRREGDSVTVTDLASRHGTVVNGVRVSEAKLSVGDTLKIGDTVLVYTLEPAVPRRGGGVRMDESLEETAREMEHGKGMETIMAGLVGDVKRGDIKQLRSEYDGDAGEMRKRLKKLGWGKEEAERFIRELEGHVEDDIRKEDIISVTLPKENERVVHVRRKVKGAGAGSVIRFESRDYLVLESSYSEQDQTGQYRLKEC